jgi:hypothetical protein
MKVVEKDKVISGMLRDELKRCRDGRRLFPYNPFLGHCSDHIIDHIIILLLMPNP